MRRKFKLLLSSAAVTYCFFGSSGKSHSCNAVDYDVTYLAGGPPASPAGGAEGGQSTKWPVTSTSAGGGPATQHIGRRLRSTLARGLLKLRGQWTAAIQPSFPKPKSRRESRGTQEAPSIQGEPQQQLKVVDNELGPFQRIRADPQTKKIMMALRVKDNDHPQIDLISDSYGQWFNSGTRSLHEGEMPLCRTVIYKLLELETPTELQPKTKVPDLLHRYVLPWIETHTCCTPSQAASFAAAAGIVQVVEMTADNLLYKYVIPSEGVGFFLPLCCDDKGEVHDCVKPQTPLKYRCSSLCVLTPLQSDIPVKSIWSAARAKIPHRALWSQQMSGYFNMMIPYHQVPESFVVRAEVGRRERKIYCNGGSFAATRTGQPAHVYGHELPDGTLAVRDDRGTWWNATTRTKIAPPNLEVGVSRVQLLELLTCCDVFSLTADDWTVLPALGLMVCSHLSSCYGPAAAGLDEEGKVEAAEDLAVLQPHRLPLCIGVLDLLHRKTKSCVSVCLEVDNLDLSRPPMFGALRQDTFRPHDNFAFEPDEYEFIRVRLAIGRDYNSKQLQELSVLLKNALSSRLKCEGVPVLEALAAATAFHNKLEMVDACPNSRWHYAQDKKQGFVAPRKGWQPVAVFNEKGGLHAVADCKGDFWDWESKLRLVGPAYVLPGYTAVYYRRAIDGAGGVVSSAVRKVSRSLSLTSTKSPLLSNRGSSKVQRSVSVSSRTRTLPCMPPRLSVPAEGIRGRGRSNSLTPSVTPSSGTPLLARSPLSQSSNTPGFECSLFKGSENPNYQDF